MAPSPGSERGADRDAGTEPDRAADHYAACRPGKHHQRIVGRYIDYPWSDRKDLDISLVCHHIQVTVRLEITEVHRLLSHALNCVHELFALRQLRTSQLLHPGRIPRHH